VQETGDPFLTHNAFICSTMGNRAWGTEIGNMHDVLFLMYGVLAHPLFAVIVAPLVYTTQGLF